MIPRIMAAIQEMSHLEIRTGNTLVRPAWAKFDKSLKISTLVGKKLNNKKMLQNICKINVLGI